MVWGDWLGLALEQGGIWALRGVLMGVARYLWGNPCLLGVKRGGDGAGQAG